MLGKNQIYCGDAFDLLSKVEEESVDLIVCDGPYGVTQNGWDRIPSIQAFNLELIKRFSRKLKDGGALYLFGKPDGLDCIDYRPFLNLKSKIVWYQPSRLAQGRLNYTNNYDVIAYFIKGRKPRCYNLEEIRVPQLVELEHRTRCENVPSVKNGRYGKTKFNGEGKNPGDVWGDIKQLTYKSKELMARDALHTMQKPEKLIERLVRASSLEGDLVLDPFAGVGTCPAVCKKNKRNYVAFELRPEFIEAAETRLASIHGDSTVRESFHGS